MTRRTTAELLKVWERSASSEEVVLDDPFILEELRDNPRTREAIKNHIDSMKRILHRLPENVAESYRPWCTDPSFYRFGSEAFHQGRILYWLLIASKMRDVSQLGRILVARQIIRPSGLNSTPRIKRAGGVDFIVYPAPSTFWLYELMSALACEIDGKDIVEAKLEEYILYLLAYRAYEGAADYLTGYGIDYLIDEIVLSGTAPKTGHSFSQSCAFLVQAVEDFIINHEISHALLDHPGVQGEGVAIEAEADMLAIELMLAEFVETPTDKKISDLTLPDRPLIGYLCLNLWGLFREAAEWRASVFLADTPDKMARIRNRSHSLKEERLARIANVPLVSKIEASKQAKQIMDSGMRIQNRLCNLEMNQKRAEDVVRLARTLAARDYSVLRREITQSSEQFLKDHSPL